MGYEGTTQKSLGLTEALLGKLRKGVSSRMVDAPAADLYEIRPRKDRDGFDLTSDSFRCGPEREQKVPDDVRRGNSLNRVSAGEFANRPPGTG
jgi:hypothetical protein